MRYSLVVPVAPGRKIEVKESIALLDYPKEEIEVIIKQGPNASKNRNRGMRRARGEIILLLDDEVYFDKDFLKNADEFFKNYTTYDILGGPQLTPETDGFFGKLSGMALASWFGTFKVSNRYKKGDINFNATEFDITSANCFIKRRVIEKIGYFHPFLSSAEEREFFSRAEAAGFKIAKSPKAVMYHKRRPSLLAFAHQVFHYGRGRPQKEIIMREKLYIELEFILVALFSIYVICLPVLFILWKPFIVPLLFYLLFIISGAVIESAKSKNLPGLFLFPALFFTIHFSYGLGLIRGLIKALFLQRNRIRRVRDKERV